MTLHKFLYKKRDIVTSRHKNTEVRKTDWQNKGQDLSDFIVMFWHAEAFLFVRNETEGLFICEFDRDSDRTQLGNLCLLGNTL